MRAAVSKASISSCERRRSRFEPSANYSPARKSQSWPSPEAWLSRGAKPCRSPRHRLPATASRCRRCGDVRYVHGLSIGVLPPSTRMAVLPMWRGECPLSAYPSEKPAGGNRPLGDYLNEISIFAVGNAKAAAGKSLDKRSGSFAMLAKFDRREHSAAGDGERQEQLVLKIGAGEGS
mgnify:CR=1 FL=1